MTADSIAKYVQLAKDLGMVNAVAITPKDGLPCEVLQHKEDMQNRYGFVLIE